MRDRERGDSSDSSDSDHNECSLHIFRTLHVSALGSALLAAPADLAL